MPARRGGKREGRAGWSEGTWRCNSVVCRADFFNKGAGAKFLEARHSDQRQMKGNKEMLLDTPSPEAHQETVGT